MKAQARKGIQAVLLVITLLASPVLFIEKSAEASDFKPIWDSAKVLIGHGNTSTDPAPSLFIECPMFFKNGRFARAFHTLDLSDPNVVKASATVGDHTVHPDFSGGSIAAHLTQGSDGEHYILVGGEGTVTDGKGYFKNVNTVIVRCKYKVTLDELGNVVDLVACLYCILILV